MIAIDNHYNTPYTPGPRSNFPIRGVRPKRGAVSCMRNYDTRMV